ncbi:MAG: hypothetical protein ACOVSW_00675 [Candidatus Kapaibacteriota bacterium]|jgi:hypothetical protein
MNTPFQHNASRPIATEAEIEALFGKPTQRVQIQHSFPITQEQREQLHSSKSQEESLALLKGWGYDQLDA